MTEHLDIEDMIWNDVRDERGKQRIRWESTDEYNGRNDYVAYITNYLGKAALMHNTVPEDFYKNMTKIAALALAAMEANKKGYC